MPKSLKKQVFKKKVKPVKVKKAKKLAKKPVKKLSKPIRPAKITAPKLVGEVTHFYDKICVAVVKLSATIHKGDMLHIESHGVSFDQVADSMQYNHKPLTVAKKGQEIGLKVKKPVKEHALIYSKP